MIIADQIQRLVEHRLVVAAVIFERLKVLIDDFVLVGERIRRNQIAAPDLRRIDFECVRGQIEKPFHHEHAVLPAGAAIGGHDRQIGEHGGKGAVIVRHHVGAEQGALAVDRDRQPIGIVRAGVVQEHILDTENAAVRGERDLGVMDLAALMRGGEEMLEPVLDPLHRTVEPHRYPRQHHLFRIEHHDLRPKAAADEGHDHAHLPFAQAEHGGKAVPDEHRRLGSVPDRHLRAARVPLRHHATGLDRRRDAVLVEKAALEDQVRVGRRAAVVALGLADMRRNIGAEIVVHMRRGFQRVFEADFRSLARHFG